MHLKGMINVIESSEQFRRDHFCGNLSGLVTRRGGLFEDETGSWKSETGLFPVSPFIPYFL
jgi:hypothetical protein